MQATRVNAFVPRETWQDPDNNETWLIFSYNEEDNPNEFPLVLKYNNKYFERRGYNSDTFVLHYKEVAPHNLAWPG
jgi:hypothetical protein